MAPSTATTAAQLSMYGESFSTVLETLRATLYDSAEMASDVNAIYQRELDHGVDAGSLATFQAAEGFGKSLAEESSVVSQSAEAAGDINVVYQSILGRDATRSGRRRTARRPKPRSRHLPTSTAPNTTRR